MLQGSKIINSPSSSVCLGSFTVIVDMECVTAPGGAPDALPTQALLAKAAEEHQDQVIEEESDSDEEEIPLSTTVVTYIVGVLRQRRLAAVCIVRFRQLPLLQQGSNHCLHAGPRL